MPATTARKVFTVLGTTDEVTACEHCGRDELKGTIVLGILDADGNVESTTHYGAVCGARAAGWTVKGISSAASAADRARKEAEHEARMAAAEREHAEFNQGFREWVYVQYGINPSKDLHEHRAAIGMSPMRLQEVYRVTLD